MKAIYNSKLPHCEIKVFRYVSREKHVWIWGYLGLSQVAVFTKYLLDKTLIRKMSLPENSETNSLGNEEDYHKILQELDQWRTTSVKIAIIGQSGVGKSTFINKFRGLTPRDKHKVDSEGTVWKFKNLLLQFFHKSPVKSFVPK